VSAGARVRRPGTRRFALVLAAPLLLGGLGACESMNNAGWFTMDDAANNDDLAARDHALDSATDALNRQQPHDALFALQPLLSTAGPLDPQAHELAGKARLRLAEYDAAIEHFTTACNAHAHPSDRARADDLVAFTTGLRSYSRGRFADARTAWAQIDHPTLRRNAFATFAEREQSVALTALDGGDERTDAP
jgi:hypothetical protein